MKVKSTLFLIIVFSFSSFVFPQEQKKERMKELKSLMSLSKSVSSHAVKSGGAAKTSAYTPGNYYAEGFEDAAFPPAGWQTKHISGDGGWMKYPLTPHSGSNVAFTYYEAGGVDWLITPQYTAYAGDSLNFYIKRYFNSVDTLWVLVASIAAVPSDDASLNAAFTDTLFVVNKNMLTNELWRQYSASLDKYAGQQIYIGFKCYNNIGTGLLLDDVELGHKLSVDVSAGPIGVKNYTGAGYPVNISGLVTNLSLSGGGQTFPVTCKILGPGNIELFSDIQTAANLAPGNYTSLTFAPWAPFILGTYTVKVYTGLAGDGNKDNDTVTAQFTVLDSYLGLNWRFESNMPVQRNDIAAASYIKKSGGQAITDTPYVFVLGGRGAAGNFTRMDTTIYIYNAVNHSWLNANAKFPQLKNFKAWQFDGKIYVPGGAGGDENAVSDLNIYDIGADTVLKGAEMPEAAHGYALGTYNDTLIYVIGGIAGSSLKNTIMIYNILKDSWDYGTPFPGTGLFRPGASICGNKIVIAGGQISGLYSSKVYVGIINPDNPYDIYWYEKGEYPTGAYKDIAAAGWFGKEKKYIYFTGGYMDYPVTSPRETWLFDIQTDNWLAGPDKVFGTEGSSGMVPVVRNDSVYMAVIGGGHNGSPNNSNEWLYIGVNDAFDPKDVSPYSVDFDTIAVNKDFIPQASFVNHQLASRKVIVTMEITPGDYVSADTIASLAYGKKKQVSFEPWTPDLTGLYNVKVSTYLVGDENTSNDTLSSQIVVKGKDVLPFSVDFDTLAAHSAYALKATFENKDYLPHTIVTYMEINPGGYISADTVENLAPHSKQQAAFATWTPDTTGIYTVKVYTYISGDENTANDTLVSLVVVESKDAAPFSINFDTIAVNVSYTPKASFENKDNLPHTLITYMEINPGSYFSADTLENAAPRAKLQVSFKPWTPDSTGIYTVKAYTYLSGDKNLSNDTLVSQVVVKGKDAAPVSVDFDTIAVNAAYTPKATFENKDYLPRTFIVTMKALPGDYISVDTLENLTPHKKRQVLFAPWIPDLTGTYTVKVYTTLAGDENTSNDTLTSQVVVINQGLDAAAFSVDFDTVTVNTAFIPKAAFMNKQVLVKPFPVTMRITPGSYESIDTVKDLAYDEKTQVSFAEWTPTAIGKYTVKIFTALEFDENMANDTLTAEIVVINKIGIDDEMDMIPDVYSLSQNYPNPFNPTTVIRYGLPEAGQVELKVYDMLGREVQTLVSEFMNAGMHEVKFNAAGLNLSSGVYIYRIKSGNFVQTKKLMLIK